MGTRTRQTAAHERAWCSRNSCRRKSSTSCCDSSAEACARHSWHGGTSPHHNGCLWRRARLLAPVRACAATLPGQLCRVRVMQSKHSASLLRGGVVVLLGEAGAERAVGVGAAEEVGKRGRGAEAAAARHCADVPRGALTTHTPLSGHMVAVQLSVLRCVSRAMYASQSGRGQGCERVCMHSRACTNFSRTARQNAAPAVSGRHAYIDCGWPGQSTGVQEPRRR